MRIRVLTALAVLLLGVPEVAQQADQPALHADRVLALKRERTLQQLSQAKVIRSYKVALGGDPIGPKVRQGYHKTPEAFTYSIRATRTASFTSRFTFRIPVCGSAKRSGREAFHRVGMCLSMVFENAYGWWDRHTD